MVEEKTDFKRQTAYKCNISSIQNGVFVKKTGWESNYVMTEFGDFSRVNIIAVVVGKDDNTITVDDGTGNISARFFDNSGKINEINVGDLVLIIARPREFNSQMYLTPEIVKKIDRSWINYRRKELTLVKKIRKVDTIKSEVPKIVEVAESTHTASSKEKIIKIISELDTGTGVNVDDLIRLSKISNAEDILNDMVLKGEIFEIKPGKLKMM
jgi:hypothetical protein